MILFIQTAFLGDLLLSIPTLMHLRKLYPDKKIHLICRKELGAFFIENQLVDIVYDNYKGKKPTWSELSGLLSSQIFDLVICPHQSFRSHYLVSKIKSSKKIGYRKWWNRFFFDSRFIRPMHLPEALRQIVLLQELDINLKQKIKEVFWLRAPFSQIPDWLSMTVAHLKESLDVRSWMEEKWKIPAEGDYLCLAPGSVWATKKWGDDHYKNLAESVTRRDQMVILLGSSSEYQLGEFVKNKQPQIYNLCGQTTLTEMAKILSRAKSLVCNDSGAMHMASVTETPTLAIFGPTVVDFGYQPWNKKALVIEDKELPCRPCSAHGTHLCPIGTHACMKNISVEQILKKI